MERAFVGTELLDGGLTIGQLRWRYKAVHPRIYVPRGAASSVELDAHAAWLWTERRGVVAGRAAAALHGAQWVHPGTPIEMIADQGRPRPGAIIREQRIDWDEVCMVGELPVTIPSRTALDLARHRNRDNAVRHLDALAAATGITAADVAPLVDRYRGSRGMKRARIALEQHQTERKRFVHDIGRNEMIERRGWLDIHVVKEHTWAFILHRIRESSERRGWYPLASSTPEL
ncbi:MULTISPECIES: type IV toxin-antitoxin system AbiEi family antitoxin [unclassified Mycobacterium]|uniref:type IV toxin-antitoxin system AbiEi family antitoxin n=1 Tax=unclassified Mycobacterium TaxID=2642494 RepID=UPI0029C8B376|nr:MULTISPECIES: type IV toxin-antitoxin system AbiEi family antitoxin [unclassified Mycobacterium]